MGLVRLEKPCARIADGTDHDLRLALHHGFTATLHMYAVPHMLRGRRISFSSDCRTMCDRDPAAGKLGGALEEMPALIEAITTIITR